MNERFAAEIESLEPSLQQLLAMTPVSASTLPRGMAKAGVYLFSEGSRHLYAGRSNNIRRRIGLHCSPGASPSTAAFAFRLARETTGLLRATYKSEGSRKDIATRPEFVAAFGEVKARIRAMKLRFVEEADSLRQALLEMYVAVALEAPYNDFNTH